MKTVRRVCLLWCLLPLAAAGCITPDVKLSNDVVIGHQSSAAIDEDLKTTAGEIKLAKPGCTPVGQGHLASAQASNAAAASKLPAINAALAAADQLARQCAALTAELKRERAQFWSDRQRALFWTIVLSISGLAVLLAVLDFCTNLSAPIDAIATVAFHVCTGGLVWLSGKISSFNAWLAARIGLAAAPGPPQAKAAAC